MDHLNIFRGPESVANYYNPDINPPLPLVEIPDRLNPFRRDGVRTYAKLLTALPAQSVKSLPALGMLLAQPDAAEKAIVEASSGSTVLSLGILSRVLWGNESVTAFVSLYGVLAQQEPTDPRGDYCLEENWKSYERWIRPQILSQLPEINIFCTTVGTGGCITGTGNVFNVFGDPNPRPRNFYGFHTCGFPWKGTVDSQQEVSSADAYRTSMRLLREGIMAGPSSGEALQGLLDYIAEAKSNDKLPYLANAATEKISCVFTCSDLPYQYTDGYLQKLANDDFSSIENEILLSCDQDRYDERWILDPHSAADMLNTSAQDFLYHHIEGAHQMSLDTLCPGAAEGVDLFGDADAVYKVWANLQILLEKPQAVDMLGNAKDYGTPVLVLCYNGEVSRLATSLLRAKGVEALSVRGGSHELWNVLDDVNS
ncbi:cysteine synthase K/M:Cysteine synthase B [Colletotrichum incanum]|nr:cysteine synthase K/M:Cysteine synthase B [Colletotrichum incanum]